MIIQAGIIIVMTVIIIIVMALSVQYYNANPLGLDKGSIAAIVLGSLILLFGFLVIIGHVYPWIGDSILKWAISLADPNKGFPEIWPYLVIASLLTLCIIYTILAIIFSHVPKSTPQTIDNTILIQEKFFKDAIMSLGDTPSKSVTDVLVSSDKGPYTMEDRYTALVNWRPMTVRLSGYLDGTNGPQHGVFDLTDSSSGVGANISINIALRAGARAFVFDIDYKDDSPCVPFITGASVNSLNTGSILGACNCLSRAFKTYNNKDPILIILNIVRHPNENQNPYQLNNFLQGIAKGLLPLAPNHLGSTEYGIFHNCASEAHLFTSQITQYQNKFIVLTNYDTSLITPTADPRNNLHFWTNARLWQDPVSTSGQSGPTPVAATPPYAQIGVLSDYINMTNDEQTKYASPNNATGSFSRFTVALAPIKDSVEYKKLNTLVNKMGIQCVGLDVLGLAAKKEHADALTTAGTTATLGYSDTTDPLSFWAYGGWSYKIASEPKTPPTTGYTIKDTFVGSMAPGSTLPVYVIPTSVVPTKPHPATNSNGGLVNIA